MSAFIGEIKPWAGTLVPAGWMYCDGSLLEVKEYPELHAVIGEDFGKAEDPAKFYLPDLRGRVAVGTGPAQANNPFPVGAQGGKAQLDPIPLPLASHTHKAAFFFDPPVAIQDHLRIDVSTALGTTGNPPNNILARARLPIGGDVKAFAKKPTPGKFLGGVSGGTGEGLDGGRVTVDPAVTAQEKVPECKFAPDTLLKPYLALHFIICVRAAEAANENLSFLGEIMIWPVALPKASAPSQKLRPLNLSEIAARDLPTKWLSCQGQECSFETASQALYSQIKGLFGPKGTTPQGADSFFLPDLARRTPIGEGLRKQGESGGSETVAIEVNVPVPEHTHGAAFASVSFSLGPLRIAVSNAAAGAGTPSGSPGGNVLARMMRQPPGNALVNSYANSTAATPGAKLRWSADGAGLTGQVEIQPAGQDAKRSFDLPIRQPYQVVDYLICQTGLYSDVRARAADTAGLIGEIKMFAVPKVPAYWLPCDGRFLYVMENPSLFGVIGYWFGKEPGTGRFALPDLRGRAVLGADPAAKKATSGNPAGLGDPKHALGEAGGRTRQTIDMTVPLEKHSHEARFQIAPLRIAVNTDVDQTTEISPNGNFLGVPWRPISSSTKEFINRYNAEATSNTSLGGSTSVSVTHTNSQGRVLLEKTGVADTRIQQSFTTVEPYLVMKYYICAGGIYPAGSGPA